MCTCLHFTGVKQACSEFLEKQLDPSNCLGIRIFAENHGCESLRQAAELYSFKYFEDVTRLEEFCTLGLKDVELLLKSDEIQAGSYLYINCLHLFSVSAMFLLQHTISDIGLSYY